MAGQLPAFAGLGALGDLDLKNLGIDQVLGGHAETSRRDLLDLGILLRAVADRIFAAFAGVGAPAKAIHGNRQGFMGFRRQGAQGHAGRVEAQQDVVGRLDLVDRYGRPIGAQLQEIAKGRRRSLVDQPRIALVVRIIAALAGLLQGRDHVGVVGMVFAAVDVAVLTAVLDRYVHLPGPVRQRALVGLQIVEGRTLQAADRAGKAGVDYLVGQADDFEQLGAAIGADGRDAHLGEDLEQALANAATVGASELQRLVTGVFDLAAGGHGVQGLVDQIGVDCRRTEADQAGNLMGIAGSAGLDDEIAQRPLAAFEKVMVNCAGGEQGMQRQMVALEVAIGDQQDQLAVIDGLLGLATEPGQRLEVGLVGRHVQIEKFRGQAELGRVDELAKLALAQDR